MRKHIPALIAVTIISQTLISLTLFGQSAPISAVDDSFDPDSRPVSATQQIAANKPYIAYDQDTIVFTHCMLADVITQQIKHDQTVIIMNGLIETVGNSKDIKAPAGATIIDCTGKTLLPGFVLTHEHMYYPNFSVTPSYIQYKQLPVTFPILYLACGATTIRTAGSIEPYSDLALRRDIDAGKIIGPSMDVTAPYLEGKGSFAPQLHELSSPEEATAFVNFWASQGATSFKAYMNMDKPTLKAAIDAAHAHGCKITGHLCATTYHEAANLGINQLEHGFLASTDFIPNKVENACPHTSDPLAAVDPDGAPAKELIQYLIAHKVAITSTLAVFEGMCTQDTIPGDNVLEAMSPDTRDMFLRYYSKGRSKGLTKSFDKDLLLEKQFSDAGGLLTVGTDPTGNGSVLAGYGSLRAIELLAKAGFTPIQIIRIATYNGAVALEKQATIGSIEHGKKADLVLIDGDISTNIMAIEHIRYVFHHGTGFDTPKLLALVKGQVGKY